MALTKTTSVDTVDAWQNVAFSTLAVGADKDISDSYETLLYIQCALTDTDANEGATVIVEVSYTGNDWVKLTEFKGTAEAPASTTINDAAVTAGDTAITLTNATTGDFDVPGRLWFIEDATPANSEAVRTKVNATHTVTLCDAILRSHANSGTVWDRCDEWVVQIPFAAAYVRTIINNTEADGDVYFSTRVSKVTSLS